MGNISLRVTFSEPVEQTSAETSGNYTIPGLSITSATRDATDSSKVTLVTASQNDAEQYLLTVASVTDLCSNLIGSPAIKQFFGIGAVDSTPPRVLYAELADSNTVLVQFSEQVEQTTAETSVNYTITDNENNSVTVSAASRQTDTCQVHIDISGTFSGGLYKITINNVQDLSTNTIASPYNVASFVGEGGIPDSIDDGPLIEDPMGEAGTSFSMLASYKGRVYIGPADTEDRMYSVKPDGTDPQLITFTFTVGATTTYSMNATNNGPDGEEGINYICGGTIGGTEYLIIGPHKEVARNLHYLYFTDDSPETGNTLNFYGADVETNIDLGGQTRGVTSMIVFNNNFYVGYPDTGGQSGGDLSVFRTSN